MKAYFERSNRFLGEPLGPAPRLLLACSFLLLIPTYVLPLWKLTMFAPRWTGWMRSFIFQLSFADFLLAQRPGYALPAPIRASLP